MTRNKGMDRRAFLRSSTAGLATGAGVSLIGTKALGANERVVCGFMGLGGRSDLLIRHVARCGNTAISHVADCDSRRIGRRVQQIEQLTRRRPTGTGDFRRILEDRSVNALFNVTPDHWHCLGTILACQAGKDVYVEKPLSHNIWEGRQAVRAARRHNRIVQVGAQNRSAPYCAAAVNYIRAGRLGEVHLVRILNMKQRGRVPARPDATAPQGVNYDMWLGPAPARPFNPNHFHGHWHWLWNYSGGDIINDGVHQIDLARWLVGKGLPASVVAFGGKYVFRGDAQESPDTQHVLYDYGDLTMTSELALWTPYMQKTPWRMRNTDAFPNWPFSATKIEVYGTRGVMKMGRHGGGWQVFGPDGRVAAAQPGRRPGDHHVANFFDCVRSRRRPNGDIEHLHLSTVLCHMANISHRVGHQTLTFDVRRELFVDNDAANRLARRDGRAPWRIPEQV